MRMQLQDRAILAFCRVEPAGLSPVMPGTCGSLAGALLAPFIFLPLAIWTRAFILVFLFFAGSWASTRAAFLIGKKDPGEIVIDEVLGQWLTYAPFMTLSWQEMAAGFVLFRLFDMVKPWPVNASEDWLPNGYGIMLDDVMAGLYALSCLGMARVLL